jgi:hypothetical protein
VDSGDVSLAVVHPFQTVYCTAEKKVKLPDPAASKGAMVVVISSASKKCKINKSWVTGKLYVDGSKDDEYKLDKKFMVGCIVVSVVVLSPYVLLVFCLFTLNAEDHTYIRWN